MADNLRSTPARPSFKPGRAYLKRIAAASLILAFLITGLAPMGSSQTVSPSSSSPPTVAPTGPPPTPPGTTVPPVENLLAVSDLKLSLVSKDLVYKTSDSPSWSYVVANQGASTALLEGIETSGTVYSISSDAPMVELPYFDVSEITLDQANLTVQGLNTATSFDLSYEMSYENHVDLLLPISLPSAATCTVLDDAMVSHDISASSTHPLSVGLYVYVAQLHLLGQEVFPTATSFFSIGPETVANPQAAAGRCTHATSNSNSPAATAVTVPTNGYDARSESGTNAFVQYWSSTCNGSCAPAAFGPAFRYTDAGRPAPLTSSQVQGALTNAGTTWEGDQASYFTARSISVNTASITIGLGDGKSDVVWVRGLDPWVMGYTPCKADKYATGAARGSVSDCEMYLNGTFSGWCTAPSTQCVDINGVIVHEYGHAIGMWHVKAGTEIMTITSTSTSLAPPTALGLGDKAGIRYVYPGPSGRYATPAGTGWYNQGADVAVGDLNLDGVDDMVFAWVDNPAGDNKIYYRVGWTVDSATGTVGSWSPALVGVDAPRVGYETQGLGIAIGNVHGTSAPDIVFAWADNPSGPNNLRYAYQYDIAASGAGTYSSVFKVNTALWVGDETQGVGVCLTNLDSTAALDIVLAWVDNPSSENTIYYRMGSNLNTVGSTTKWTTGNPPAVSKFSTTAKKTVGDETSDIGLSCADMDVDGSTDLMFAWMDAPGGPNRAYYQIGYSASASAATNTWSGIKEPPGGQKEWIGDDSAGFGVAVRNIGLSARPEFVFGWIDDTSQDNYLFYRVEWDAYQASGHY